MDQYLFFHIPKTAGSSLREYFKLILGDDQVIDPAELTSIVGIDPAALARYRMIVGHFSFEHVQRFPGRRILTFLRDPVDVLVSTYYYYRNNLQAASPTPLVVMCRELSLPEMLDRREHLKMFCNDAVRRFAGAEAHAMSDREALAIAKRNLASCDFVGIHELMSASLTLMSTTFGWPCLPLPRANVTSGRPPLHEIEPNLREAIGRANNLDGELYEFALDLFERRRHDVPAGLEKASQVPGNASTTTAKAVESAPQPGRPGPPMVSDVVSRRPGTGDIRVLSVECAGLESGRAVVRSGERCEIKATLLANASATDISIVLRLFSTAMTLVYSTRSSREGRYLEMEAGSARQVIFDVPMYLGVGSYFADLEVSSSSGLDVRLLDYLHQACRIDVSGFMGPPFGGLVDLGAEVYTVAMDVDGAGYEIGREIDFSERGTSQLYTRTGWGLPEAGQRWTDGPEAAMFCRLVPPEPGDLLLTALVQPFCPDGPVSVTAIANGRELVCWNFAPPAPPQDVHVTIPAELSRAGYLQLLFRIDRPRVPAALGLSDDPRALGVAFQRMVISSAPRGRRSRPRMRSQQGARERA